MNTREVAEALVLLDQLADKNVDLVAFLLRLLIGLVSLQIVGV